MIAIEMCLYRVSCSESPVDALSSATDVDSGSMPNGQTMSKSFLILFKKGARDWVDGHRLF